MVTRLYFASTVDNVSSVDDIGIIGNSAVIIDTVTSSSVVLHLHILSHLIIVAILYYFSMVILNIIQIPTITFINLRELLPAINSPTNLSIFKHFIINDPITTLTFITYFIVDTDILSTVLTVIVILDKKLLQWNSVYCHTLVNRVVIFYH